MSIISLEKLNIDKESIAYQGIVLGGIAGIATFVLLLIYSFTADDIKQRGREDQLAGLTQVLPSNYYQNDLLAAQYNWQINGKDYQVFVGKDDAKNISSYAVQIDAAGYAGPITLLIGLDAKLSILGVRVLEHKETPGLGDKIEIARGNWIRSFEGHSLSSKSTSAWAVKKDGGDFDQFTGATITPRAIVKEIHQTLQVMKSDIVALVKKASIAQATDTTTITKEEEVKND